MALWKRLRDRARLARELSPSDWLSLLEAWLALTVYWLSLHWASYERLSAAPPSDSPVHAPALITARRLHRIIGLAARLHLLSMTCLVQSLSLRWMLKRRGIPSSVRIGAASVAGAVRAHAWLELDGEKIGESEDVDGLFRTLSRGTFPPGTS